MLNIKYCERCGKKMGCGGLYCPAPSTENHRVHWHCATTEEAQDCLSQLSDRDRKWLLQYVDTSLEILLVDAKPNFN
jgi:hypothetical protein